MATLSYETLAARATSIIGTAAAAGTVDTHVLGSLSIDQQLVTFFWFTKGGSLTVDCDYGQAPSILGIYQPQQNTPNPINKGHNTVDIKAGSMIVYAFQLPVPDDSGVLLAFQLDESSSS